MVSRVAPWDMIWNSEICLPASSVAGSEPQYQTLPSSAAVVQDAAFTHVPSVNLTRSSQVVFSAMPSTSAASTVPQCSVAKSMYALAPLTELAPCSCCQAPAPGENGIAGVDPLDARPPKTPPARATTADAPACQRPPRSGRCRVAPPVPPAAGGGEIEDRTDQLP